MSKSKSHTYRTILWRILQPIILGSTANIIVNYVFNPQNPDFILSEFVVAILFSAPITELNFHIDKKLEARYSWTRSFKKRFLFHSSLLTISALFVLNVIGNTYTWIVEDGFYTLNELVTINLILIIVLFLITFFNWGTSFYRGWQKTEKSLDSSKKEIEMLNSTLDAEAQTIVCHQGKKQVSIPIKKILMAKSEYGVVRISMEEGLAIYQGSLQNLVYALPTHLFFQVSRSTVVHREIVKSISSSTYGKISVEIKELEDPLTVSRQKAAAFRRWYHSSSSQNL